MQAADHLGIFQYKHLCMSVSGLNEGTVKMEAFCTCALHLAAPEI